MKIRGIRWWMVGLITLGLIVNYLARNTLSVAAPSMMKDLDFGPAQYSQIVVAWQLCYAFMQPVAGTVVDAIGTKLGFAAFALAWSLVCAAAALATGWRSLAFLRGLLGLTEAAGFPAGVKATTEWFPERERSVAIGWFNAGTSIGAIAAPPLVVWAILHGSWQLAFAIVGGLGLLWCVLWMLLYRHPRDQTLLSDEEREYIVSGQEAQYADPNAHKMSWGEILSSRNFWSIGIPRILSEPAWQTFNAWIPLYMMTERHMNLKEVALFAWLPFLAADIGCVLGGYLSPIFVRTQRVMADVAQACRADGGDLHDRSCLRRPGRQSLYGDRSAVRRRLRASDFVGRALFGDFGCFREKRGGECDRTWRHDGLSRRGGVHCPVRHHGDAGGLRSAVRRAGGVRPDRRGGRVRPGPQAGTRCRRAGRRGIVGRALGRMMLTPKNGGGSGLRTAFPDQ